MDYIKIFGCLSAILKLKKLIFAFRIKPLIIALIFFFPIPSYSDVLSVFKEDSPQQYVVKSGDTLWDIANLFLKDPWKWTDIWSLNPFVSNPHLIYPGDTLIIVDGKMLALERPKLSDENQLERSGTNNDDSDESQNIQLERDGRTVLSPKIKHRNQKKPIPIIPPERIEPFLNKAFIVDDELKKAGYVIAGLEQQTLISRYDSFFADVDHPNQFDFNVFRPSVKIKNPRTRKTIGIEGFMVGVAERIASKTENGITKLYLVESNREVRAGDRLLPYAKNQFIPYFQISAPKTEVRGHLLYSSGKDGSAVMLSQYDTVIISQGSNAGLVPGNILLTLDEAKTAKHPKTRRKVKLPANVTGRIMVVKPYEDISYAIVMDAYTAIMVGGEFRSP